jgi:hypothetical protein
MQLGNEWTRNGPTTSSNRDQLIPAPGIYRRHSDGARRAINVANVQFDEPPRSSGWQERLSAIERAEERSTRFAGIFCVVAIVLALGSVMSIRRKPVRAVDF